MNPAIFLLWLAVGICPDWWPFPRPPRVVPPRPPFPPDPGPGPNPGPLSWATTVLSGLGGIAGGWLFASAWSPTQNGVDAVYAATTCIGALVGSILVRGLAVGFLRGRSPEAR